MEKRIFPVIIGALLLISAGVRGGNAEAAQFRVLCYHDIPAQVKDDLYGVDVETFVETLEYLKTHGYNFLRPEEIIAANEGEYEIPPKSVLLTSDDAYKSFCDNVLPIIEQYKIPFVLSVVTSWIENPKSSSYVKAELMSWEELKKVAKSKYVYIASHTHDLHKGVIYNPQGNEAAAAANRIYDAATGTYESEEIYRRRISSDFSASKRILKRELGLDTEVLTWPYGKYNSICLEEAKKLGFRMFLTLEDIMADTADLDGVARFIVHKNPDILNLLKDVRIKKVPPASKRIVQVDLDMVYDPDPEQANLNLGCLLDRILELKPTTVYLQAFADPDGDGDVNEVYFPNRALPVRGDFFNRVTHQLKTRANVEVYAWMPMLSIILPDAEKTAYLRVREYDKKEGIRETTSWYKRLSPFAEETKEILVTLYEDLAVNAFIDGVIFQDDGYLNDYEDFHSEATQTYNYLTGSSLKPPFELNQDAFDRWTNIKTEKLIELSRALMEVVKYHRPQTCYARTLYAPVVTDPESEEWFAQNYEASLEAYDYVVIMAYPCMERPWNAKSWLKDMVREAKGHPQGLEKTVFKLQVYDWKRKRLVKDKTLLKWMRYLVSAGARHIAYYPDNYIKDKPAADRVRSMMSVEDFPFERRK